MNILVIGEEENFNECRSKFGSNHVYVWLKQPEDLKKKIAEGFIVFDFILERNPERFKTYAAQPGIIFVSAVNFSLNQLATSIDEVQCTLLGFCGLPTFFDRSVLEISLSRREDESELKRICDLLKVDFRIVQDRVGLVTPRVVCMIINEAYYAIEEGVASREDIDNAMKLGTNYPFGPFEWCKKIGIKNVYNLLKAVYKETKDERYRISALLESESLK